MFVRPARRWRSVVAGILVLVVIAAGIVVAAVKLRSARGVQIQGTFTMFEPLACDRQSPSSILRTELMFLDPSGAELARATASSDAMFTSETVLGFVHCREVGTYRVRLKRAVSYTVQIPQFQETLPPVTYQALAAKGFRYDLHY
jgi:hypothetical protein